MPIFVGIVMLCFCKCSDLILKRIKPIIYPDQITGKDVEIRCESLDRPSQIFECEAVLR